jgi:DNA-binding IclR family transcriptional regulator
MVDARDGVSVSTISREMKLAKSATHRLLNTMLESGYVRRDPISERYHLTLRLPALGFRYLSAHGLTDVIQPILDRLAAETGELVQLGLIERRRIIWVAWAQGSKSPLRYVPVLGREIILYTTASGVVWLSSLDEPYALKILREQGFVRTDTPGYGRRAVRNEKEFVAKMAEARRLGYAFNLEEGEPGINAVAMAFRGNAANEGPVVGTLAVAGPSIRATKARLIRALPYLRAACRDLSEAWPMRVQITPSLPNDTFSK